MAQHFQSKLGPLLYHAEEKNELGVLDDEMEFDIYTDEVSDALTEALSRRLTHLPAFHGKTIDHIKECLFALRDDKNIDLWPIWRNNPSEAKIYSQEQLELLAPIAKCLRKIHDNTNWIELDENLFRLEGITEPHGVKVAELKQYLIESYFDIGNPKESKLHKNRQKKEFDPETTKRKR